MILIEEKPTEKAPGITSLFVSFNYRPDLVEFIKTCSGAVYHKDAKIWEVPLTNLAKLLDGFCEYDEINVQLLEEKNIKEQEIECNIGSYKTKPYYYQLEGIKYGLNHERWMLLDEPGLGKTLQMIYLAQELKEREGIEHCLIICGINTLKNNWKKEILQHSDLSCRILGERTTRKGTIKIGSISDRVEDLKRPLEEFFIITNIETLRDDSIIKELVKGKSNKFDMIVSDESHAFKNCTSQQGKNFLKLTGAKYRIALTGTPLLNSPVDAYVPLKWLGLDKSNFTTFKYYYCNYTGQFNNILLGYKNLDTLKYQLEKFSLRRKKDLLELPPKTIINEYVDMNPKQATFYENIKDGLVEQVDKVEMSTANLLAMVARLRQATACPSILTTEDIVSSKTLRAAELTEEIVENGSKVIIFSTFKESLNPLMKTLEKYHPLLCTGDVKDTTISENVDKFQNSDYNKVMLCTWQKMGTGITLTAASYAIYLDTPWTDAVYQQSQDRIYRIGTKNSVFIYNLICKDTIDERVLEIVQSKQAVSDYVVDDKISPTSLNNLKKYILELSTSCTD